jgi:hypothetical protein
MQRGSQSLFSHVFIEPAPTRNPEGRGRSEELIKARNELLLHRYYYYMAIHNKRYDWALQKLESELFLSQRRIIDVMEQERALLLKLRADKPDIAYFRSKFPFMVW